MAENKKIVVTKEEAEAILKKAKEKEVENKVEEIIETPVEETVEEHIFKGAKKDSYTFAEKAAEAAAQAALKSVVETNSEIAVREAEKAYFLEKKKHMLEKCKKSKPRTITVPKLYASYIGKFYTFTYNCIPVTVYPDGKPHEYPGFIADKIEKKLAKIAASNTYKELVDDRTNEQDTF